MTYLQGPNSGWKEFGPIKALEHSEYLNNAKYFTRISSLMRTIRAKIPPYTPKKSSRVVHTWHQPCRRRGSNGNQHRVWAGRFP